MTYVPDPELVFRGIPTKGLYRFSGDSYSPAFGVEPVPIEGVTEINQAGFAEDGSSGAPEVILFGDSFLQLGSGVSDMFVSHFRRASGRSSSSFALAWYGPHQYLELFRRFGVSSGARQAVFCIFGGNDLRDMREYLHWQKGGRFYHFRLSSSWGENLLEALKDVFFLSRVDHGLPRQSLKKSDLMELRLGKTAFPVYLAHYVEPRDSEAILRSEEGMALANILREFRSLSEERGIKPYVFFVPSSMQIYGRYLSKGGPGEGAVFHSFEHAVRSISRQEGVSFIDAVPAFEAAAKRGEFLYHPFDTHWNARGRELASALLAEELGKGL